MAQTRFEDTPEFQKIMEALRAKPGNAPSYDFDELKEMENSPLKGKKICVLGSSVAFGAGSFQLAIPEYFSRRLGVSFVKETVSGTTLATSLPNNYIERLLKNVSPDEDFSLFICQLSTNDATRKLPLGEINKSEDRSEFNTETVTGAIEYIIAYARETWNCPVVFFTGSWYDSQEYSAMVERLKELQKKWDIGILNLFDDASFNELSEEQRALYMNDPIHPTKAGYRDWWGPELERQLMGYLA